MKIEWKNDEMKEFFIENTTNIRYFAKNNGEIYTMNKGLKIKKLKLFKRKDGYEFINILDSSKRRENGTLKNRTIGVHSIIASIAFNNGIYQKELEVNHIDLNKSNNNVYNLEIVNRLDQRNHWNETNNTYVTKTEKYAACVKGKYLGCFLTEEMASKKVLDYITDNEIVVSKYFKNKILPNFN